MPYADSEGIRIHYQMEGEGPPLVLHHWSLATMNDWYDYGYVSALQNDYRLILLDARGHGASDKPHRPEAYKLGKRVKDVVAVLDDLGISRVHFFGYSMGGWIGFGAARYAPERFLSLIIGGQHPYKQSMTGLRQLVRYGVDNGPEAFIAMWEENFGPILLKAKARMLKYDYEALLLAAQDRESLEDVLTAMNMPCLLYAGEMDEVYPIAKKCAQQIANAKFASLPGLGHGGAISRSDEILPHIKMFLAVVSRGTNGA
jgi:pimeloyl-ACP methyl ester carboxylesterase